MPTEDITSLANFKSDASGWIERLQHQGAVVLTQNGRGRAVVQSYEAYRQMQDSLAMMQIVVQGEADIRAGRTTPHEEVFTDLRRELHARATRSVKDKR
ncbi:MAG: type II toxin-antitoxin system prevent-host-death family antitoxin [Luteimonas sp.]